MPADDHHGLMRLIWQKDPRGYEIVRFSDLRNRHTVPVLGRAGEPRELGYWVSEDKHRDGETGRITRDDSEEFIVPRCDPRVALRYRPYTAELKEHAIYRQLANSEQRPGQDGVKEFVNAWGLLTRNPISPLKTFLRQRHSVVRAINLLRQKKSVVRDHLDSSGNDVETLLEEVVRSGVVGFGYAEWAEEDLIFEPRPGVSVLGMLHARFDARKGELYFQADTLLQFCALELLYDNETNKIDFTRCPTCRRLLPAHKKGRRKKYCDDKCKMADYRAAHGEAINRALRLKRDKLRRAAAQ